MQTNQELISSAIKQKRPIRAIYDNYQRELCPHAMGWKDNVMNVLCFQFGGSSSKGLPIIGEWKCMQVDKLRNVSLQSGEWHTSKMHTRTQTCIDQIVIQIDH
jgi:hypothetical protein